jgi:hypothetical protein
VLWSLAAILFYFASEAAIFRTGWYEDWLEPNSTAGEVEYHMRWLKRAKPAKVPEVLIVGDSRMAEGFSALTAGAEVNGKLHFTNFGVPGSAPRVWYYMVRDADPDRNRFSTIAIAFDEYSDQDWGEDPRNRREDVNYLAGRLEIDDCFDFADSFPKTSLRPEILTQCFFKGVALRSDVQAFLSDIPDRIARAKDWRNNGGGYIEGYEGKPEELTGLTADLEKREINFPPGLKDWQTNTVRSTVLPEQVRQTGALTNYRKEWIGSIVDLYKGSNTRLVFFQIPRAPWPIPEPSTRARFIESVAAQKNILIISPDTFKDLERPEVFADGLHLNKAGREIFSKRIAERLASQ